LGRSYQPQHAFPEQRQHSADVKIVWLTKVGHRVVANCLGELSDESNVDNINIGVSTDILQRALVVALAPVNGDIAAGSRIESSGRNG
jgi:hypothetical protein